MRAKHVRVVDVHPGGAELECALPGDSLVSFENQYNLILVGNLIDNWSVSASAAISRSAGVHSFANYLLSMRQLCNPAGFQAAAWARKQNY